MPTETLAPPPAPEHYDDVLTSYGDYVFSSYLITGLVLGFLIVRSVMRSNKVQQMHTLLSARSEETS